MSSVGRIVPYFSWIEDKVLAVSALPYHHSHLKYLVNNGVRVIVWVGDSNPPPLHTTNELRSMRVSVDSSRVPSLNSCLQFVDIVQRARQRREVNSTISLVLL